MSLKGGRLSAAGEQPAGRSSGQKALLAANWKMNPSSALEAIDLVNGVLPVARSHEQVDVVLFPPFPWLLGVAELVEDTGIALGAQNCYWEQSGAYTGEVSAQMLAGWCSWVIVGHSERRRYFGETDADIARKAAAAVAAGLNVILCVGEREEHYTEGSTHDVVASQLQGGLAECSADDSRQLTIAYEPVWAIGTGRNADPEHAYKTMRHIRSVVGDLIGKGAADRVRVLYGGSVTAENIQTYVELPRCDGCLVGGASINADEFNRIIEVTAEVYGPVG